MIEMEGVEALSLNVLAEALGVKTPSLYRYVDGRAGLLRALNLQTVQQLVAATQAAHDSHTSGPRFNVGPAGSIYRHDAPVPDLRLGESNGLYVGFCQRSARFATGSRLA